jgi:hypothetical protein
VRYRFRVEEAEKGQLSRIPPGISLIERNGPWLTCSIEGQSPAQAIKRLVNAGLPLVEAEPVTGGLEELYLKHTAGGVQ